MVETQITDLEDAKSRLEAEIREAKYDERIRDKTVSIRQKETDRDRANGELSALNRQADSRAQLSIKRNELNSKNSQVTASLADTSLDWIELISRIASHAQRFKELVGSDAEPETMEEKITLALGYAFFLPLTNPSDQ